MQKLLTRCAYILAGATLIAVPLFYAPSSLFPLSFPKTIVFQILVEMLAAVAIALWLYVPATRLRRTGGLMLVGLFFTAQVAAAVGGVDWHQSWWSDMVRSTGLFFQLHLFVFIAVLASGIFTTRARRALVVVSLSTAAVVSIIAIWQHFNPDLLPNVSAARTGTTLGNPLFFAAYALLSLFGLLLLLEWYGTRTYVRVLVSGAAVLFLVGIYFAQGRGSLVGIVVGAAVYFFLRLFAGSSRQRRWGYGLAVLALAGFVGVWFVRGMPFATRVPLLNLFTQTTTLQTRVANWHMAWDGFLARPFLGWGPENFRRVADAHFDSRLSNLSYLESFTDKPHNQFLEILATSGAIGFLAYIAVAMYFTRLLMRAHREGRIRRREAHAWYALAIAHAVQLFFLFETATSFVVVGLAAAILLGMEQEAHAPPVQPIRLGSAVRTGTLVTVVCALMLLGYRFNVQSWRASVMTNDGLQYTYVDDWLQARVRFRAAFPIPMPYDFERWRWISAATAAQAYERTPHQRADELPAAIQGPWQQDVAYVAEEGEHLLRIGPKNYLEYSFVGKYYYQVATVTKNPQYFTRAKTLFQEAIALAPRREEGYLLVAQVLLLEGKYAEAAQVVEPLRADPHASPLVYWYRAFPLLQIPSERATGLGRIWEALEADFLFENNQQIYAVAQAFVDEKDFQGLVRFYEWVSIRRPRETEWLVYLAAAYAQTGQYGQARATVEHSVELDPSLRASADQFLKTLPTH